MLIKEIAKLCKQRKTVYLTVREGVQWLGDGVGMYPLMNMPRLDKNTVFSVLDIPADKIKEYDYQETDFLFTHNGDYCPDDVKLKSCLSLSGYGRAYISEAGEACFVNDDYIRPLKEYKGDISLYVRETGNGRIIAICSGLLIVGLVTPAIYPETSTLYEKLLELINGISATSDNAIAWKEGDTE